MSSGGTVGVTLTAGIQDIAALLPLLGTEQCEDHISSALTKGYLYAAATPLSIFGSLGIVRAGFKTVVASFSIPKWGIVGARTLADMGFKPQGENLSLIMADESNQDRYLVETRLEDLLEELNIDNAKNINVVHRCARWNLTMTFLTAVSCVFSVVPYIYLDAGVSNYLNSFTRWAFPILRAIGGLLTVAIIQIVIQRRTITLLSRRLAARGNQKRVDNEVNELQVQQDAHGSTASDSVAQAIISRRNQRQTKTTAKKKQANDLRSHTHDVGKSVRQIGQGSPSDLENGLKGFTAIKELDIITSLPKPRKTTMTNEQTIRNPVSADGNSALTWLFLLLLLIGIFSLIVGYVGCFSIVQNTESLTGPISWLCLEASLSVIRMIIWGLNPTSDDAPPLQFVLALDGYVPLPTCMKYDNEIKEEKVLLLTRASQFLESITSFCGLIEPFDISELSLYYTLTRKNAVISDDLATPGTPGERVLYITIFDHRERTMRIYTRDSECDHFYSTEMDIPTIDLKHGLLDAKLGEEIDPSNDPIASNAHVRYMLTAHYQSIMDQLRFTIGDNNREYVIENGWTMNIVDTMSLQQRQREEGEVSGMGKWQLVVEEGKRREINGDDLSSGLDCRYLELGRLERMRRSLLGTRGEWIEDYMRWAIEETRQRFTGAKTMQLRIDGNRVETNGKLKAKSREVSAEAEGLKWSTDVDSGSEAIEVEILLVEERYQMEMLLADEVDGWEAQLEAKMQAFLDGLGDRTSEKTHVVKTWLTDCWRRLNTEMQAMDDRMNAAREDLNADTNNEISRRWKEAHGKLHQAWQFVINRYIKTSGLLSLPSPSLPRSRAVRLRKSFMESASDMNNRFMWTNLDDSQQGRCWTRRAKMEKRLQCELEDIESRLERGLEHCDKYWSDAQLVECRHSQAKWLELSRKHLDAPLEVYADALKRNKEVVFIDFRFFNWDDRVWVVETTKDMPSLTSIKFRGSRLAIPSCIQDNHYLLSINGDFVSSSELQAVLNRNRRQLQRTRGTTIFMEGAFQVWDEELRFGPNSSITISFWGPMSGTLALRFIHRSNNRDTTLKMKGMLNFELCVPLSHTIDDITLHPSPSSGLSFDSGIRNEMTLVAEPPFSYYLQDVQLLDEDGKLYNPSSL